MNKLKRYFKNYYVLNDISGILFWDNATNLPSKSIESRSDQMSILAEYIDQELRDHNICLLYTSPSPRDAHESRMPSSA